MKNPRIIDQKNATIKRPNVGVLVPKFGLLLLSFLIRMLVFRYLALFYIVYGVTKFFGKRTFVAY